MFWHDRKIGKKKYFFQLFAKLDPKKVSSKIQNYIEILHIKK